MVSSTRKHSFIRIPAPTLRHAVPRRPLTPRRLLWAHNQIKPCIYDKAPSPDFYLSLDTSPIYFWSRGQIFLLNWQGGLGTGLCTQTLRMVSTERDGVAIAAMGMGHKLDDGTSPGNRGAVCEKSNSQSHPFFINLRNGGWPHGEKLPEGRTLKLHLLDRQWKVSLLYFTPNRIGAANVGASLSVRI